MKNTSVSPKKPLSDLSQRLGAYSMRGLSTALIFALLFVFQGVKAQAQYAIGVSAIAANPMTVDTYSSTELDALANYYYDPYVEGYLYRKYFTSLNWDLIRSGSAFGGSVSNIADGYMSAPTEVRSRYQHESDHYVVSYYYTYQPCCGYTFYNPAGYGFASNDGTQWPSGYQFLPGPAPVWVQRQYHYLGTTAVTVAVSPPAIEAIQPTAAQRGQGGVIQMFGSYMSSAYQAQFSGSGATASVSYVSENQANIQFNINSTAATGVRQLSLTNQFGTSNQVDFLIADPTPVITGVAPATWEAGSNVNVVIDGSGFGSNPTLQISGGGVTSQITAAGDTQIHASLSISPNATAGPRNLTVTSNGYGGNPFVASSGTRPTSDPASCQVVQPSVTVGSLSAILKGNSRQIDVTVSSTANQKATLTLKTKSGTSGVARFSDDSTTKEVGVGKTTIEIKGVTESSEVDDLFIEAKIAGVTKEEYFSVVILKLKEVSYSGTGNQPVYRDDLGFRYDGPHWQDNSAPLNGTADDSGDKKYPLAFVKESRVVYTARWEPAPAATLDGLTVKVKGNARGGIFPPVSVPVVPETTATVSESAVSISSVPSLALLPNSVNYLSAYTIDWEVSSDQSWISAGTSNNKIYLLLATPPAGLRLQQTLLDIGCQNAAGLIDQTSILNAVWTKFSSLNVTRKRYDPQQNVISEEKMTYYKSYLTSIVRGDVLLASATGDGQCGSWATLLVLTLRAIGVTLPMEYVTVTPLPSSIDPPPPTSSPDIGIFVKSWSFIKSSDRYPNFPYWNPSRADTLLISDTRYNWLPSPDVDDDLGGIPGQGGVANPASLFNNHQFIKIDGKYYDASYGAIYLNNDAFVAKLDALYVSFPESLNERTVSRDLNGDGEITDIVILTRSHFMKSSPPTSAFLFTAVPLP
jgi:hypothetical protein